MPGARIAEVSAFPVANALPQIDAVEAYSADGVVCLRNAFGGEWLDIVEAGIDIALNRASADLDVVKAYGDEGQFSFSSQAWT